MIAPAFGGGATLVDVANERAASLGDALALRYLVSGDIAGPSVELSYAGLVRRSRAIAALLQQHGGVGDRALLLFPSGLDFVTAFFGCLFAGLIPVPAYPPDLAKPERALTKLRGIVADCGATIALTTGEFLPTLARVAPMFPELAALRCLATDTCDDELGLELVAPSITSESVAFLQYTSGSTGAPKGAVLRHRQLMANEASIASAMGHVGLVVGWLPIFHDMGLIGNVLQVLFAGTSLVLMSPIAFLKRPARWLEAISHYQAVTSGGPNFAYDLCIRRVTLEERARLDLRSWKVAYCGAEPVRQPTIDRFCATFGSTGFARSSMFPCYGLAEATLFVAGNPRGVEPTVLSVSASGLERGEVLLDVEEEDDRRMLVSCGRSSATEEIRIVDPDRRSEVAANRVGEIWVRGPGIASGYWGREAESQAVFRAQLAARGDDAFLRTGDLGFLHAGDLYVAGRLKDMIILGGRNLFPQDIEESIEAAVAEVRKGCCAAFSVERDGEERLIVVAEHAGVADDIARRVKRVVAEQHQASVFEVVLLAKGAIPKTSSGKLERYACRMAYVKGTT